MGITEVEARELLSESGLRPTAPRIAVVQVLEAAEGPLSHSDVLQRLGTTSCDPATIYRSLIKLRDAGISPVVSRADGIDRYMLAQSHEGPHNHAHFVCDDCGKVACLPPEVTASFHASGPWAASIHHAMVQLRGECPECIDPASQSPVHESRS